MKATIRHTTHANLKPGTKVEVTGYCAKVTATFDDATPNAKPKHETREVFFGLGDLEFHSERGARLTREEMVANLEAAYPGGLTGVYTAEEIASGRTAMPKMPEIPTDLPKPAPTTQEPAKAPTIAPQSADTGYLADILSELRDIKQVFHEIYSILNENRHK